MTFCFLDTETLGLSLLDHDIWEIAYTFDDDPLVYHSMVSHNAFMAEPEALAINNYIERGGPLVTGGMGLEFEKTLVTELHQRRPIIVGANPEFDKYRLSRRWGWQAPWHHRSIDVESYLMSMLGIEEPVGLSTIAQMLADLGYDVPEPDHTAAGDVHTVRAAFRSGQAFYESLSLVVQDGGTP